MNYISCKPVTLVWIYSYIWNIVFIWVIKSNLLMILIYAEYVTGVLCEDIFVYSTLLLFPKGLIFVCVGPWHYICTGLTSLFVFYMVSLAKLIIWQTFMFYSLKEAYQIFSPSCLLMWEVVLDFIQTALNSACFLLLRIYLYSFWLHTDPGWRWRRMRLTRGILIMSASWAQEIKGSGKYGPRPWWS